MHSLAAAYRPIALALLAAVAVLLASTLGGAPAVFADTVSAGDDFESGDFEGGTGLWNDDWTVTGDAEVRSGGGPHGGEQHVRLRKDSARIERGADLDGLSNVRLQFWAKTGSIGSGDAATVQVSPDRNTWTTLFTWSQGQARNEYNFFDLAIPVGLTDTFWVAFDAQMKGSGQLFVDDVAFVQVGDEGGDPPLGEITLDGQFDEWTGLANLSDPSGDAEKVQGDLQQFFWANDVSGDVNFWMIRRYGNDGNPFNGDNGQKKSAVYTIFVDTNDDGVFIGAQDRRVRITYKPKKNDSDVKVEVRPGSGGKWKTLTKKQDWGDSKSDGGTRVEFGVNWADLGIGFGQPIRMYVESNKGDRLPDTGDVQWSPASILGTTLLAIVFAGGIALVWWFRGRHVWRRG